MSVKHQLLLVILKNNKIPFPTTTLGFWLGVRDLQTSTSSHISISEIASTSTQWPLGQVDYNSWLIINLDNELAAITWLYKAIILSVKHWDATCIKGSEFGYISSVSFEKWILQKLHMKLTQIRQIASVTESWDDWNEFFPNNIVIFRHYSIKK